MINCVCPNPAIDKIFITDELHYGEIHRPRFFMQLPGGKGTNVARAGIGIGSECQVLVPLGGHLGDWYRESAADEGIPVRASARAGEVRSALSVAADNRTGLTEFYERGSEISDREWEEFVALVEACVGEQEGGWVTISGSLPPGAPEDGVGRLLDRACAGTARVAVDLTGTALREAFTREIGMIKVNVHEAGETLDEPGVDLADALRLARRLADHSDAEQVVVTAGKDGIAAVRGDDALTGTLDFTGDFPVGSGDSALAGFLVAEMRGSDLAGCVASALAAGAANAAQPGAGRLDPDLYRELLLRVVIDS